VGNSLHILAIRPCDGDLQYLAECGIERLSPYVEFMKVESLSSLEHVVYRCLVPGQTESPIAAIVVGNVVEVPEIAMKPT
jgi:hypothetical protein